jgi:hypothetical protein
MQHFPSCTNKALFRAIGYINPSFVRPKYLLDSFKDFTFIVVSICPGYSKIILTFLLGQIKN